MEEQIVGSELQDSGPSPLPKKVTLKGKYVTIAPLDPQRDAEDLWDVAGGDAHKALWTYLSEGPFLDRPAFDASLERKAQSTDPLYFALIDIPSQRTLGHASYLRITPAHRCIEVGAILYSASLQRTAAATEAMFLMARHAFEDLHYRRYEWKCDALNEPSRRAAARLGFTYEGIFRQHMIVKGRNRDTAWFSMLDTEWPSRKRAFEEWLSTGNFDDSGRQKRSLASFRQ